MKELYSAHPAMFRNRPIWFSISLLLCSVFVGLIILVIWYLQIKASKLSITEQEILYEKGLLSKERDEIKISNVRTVKVKQSFFNRLLGVGTVEIFTAGDHPEVVAAGMPNPNKIRELIKTQQNG